MAHRHYHTKGFVLNLRPLKEKDLLISVFTHDLGLIRAIIKSGREVRSKLRPHGSRFGDVNITLVRGKEWWRVVGLETGDTIKGLWSNTRAAVPAARVFDLLEKLLPPEEPMISLFDDFYSLISMFKKSQLTEPSFLANLECLAVLRILHHLGYLPDLAFLAPFTGALSLDEATVKSLTPVRLEAIRAINSSLNETGI
ncbi:MAG: DNA repair protein RecO [Candidatus Vogelbacteria bacterium RIFOXYD1_FULL_44_32]|uniref:DNA repair protein RecO n=1 Tax=Candidatus Vogelbacteria bacterium RIFOXYD1_FULL_44_32 TaxID=1802438 RepID=A0A1G2QED7_9BACT|nr:MAG: DNA repair protein RecO [Candidatus Vogelbacteria bacterium RIFOXYD1_FULL_44_32]